MQKRRCLGQTNLLVSEIGLGTVKFGRNQGLKYPNAFDLPTDAEILRLLDCASDLGINLLDTAPAYGQSEERLGKLLFGQRADWVLMTKAGEEFMNGQSYFDFSKAGMTASVERSLMRLKTDYLDILLVHSNGDDERVIDECQVFATLAELKQAGKIRAYGMSTKTVAGGLRTVNESDVVMITYHPGYTDEKAVIDAAQLAKKGILIKKAFASGHLDTFTPQQSLHFILQEPAVTSVIVGTLNPKHLQENVLGVV